MKKLIVLTFVLIVGFAITSYAAFQSYQQPSRTPHIGTVVIELMRTVDPDESPQESIEYRITIDDQLDRPMGHKNGNLIPHLTTAQKNQLIAFMDVMWTKAEDEILP